MDLDAQIASRGVSTMAIREGALAAATPGPNLSWLDIGCGTGVLLRMIGARHKPRRLTGVDVVDWLEEDLRGDVEYYVAPAERLPPLEASDRVLLVEVLEHVEAPWSVLRTAARLVKPGGVLVLTTPNVKSFKNRLKVGVQGEMVAFLPDNLPHLTPILPHVCARVLREEGLDPDPPFYAAGDYVLFGGGRTIPEGLRRRSPRLLSMCLGVRATRPLGQRSLNPRP